MDKQIKVICLRKNHLTITIGICFSFLWVHENLFAQSVPILEIGKFSSAKIGGPYPNSWEPLTFKNIKTHTEYLLVESDGMVVVKAISQGSSSGLVKRTKINPKIYPIIEWKWKIENILKNGDVTSKEGDDYPARIYITFEYESSKVGFLDKTKYETARLLYGQYPPIAAINYIWESKSLVETILPNPYTEQVQMIVVESGNDKVGKWILESRNIFEDYKQAFGENPPMISGVALMTDTDNTKESAIAYYGDIVFKRPIK